MIFGLTVFGALAFFLVGFEIGKADRPGSIRIDTDSGSIEIPASMMSADAGDLPPESEKALQDFIKK